MEYFYDDPSLFDAIGQYGCKTLLNDARKTLMRKYSVNWKSDILNKPKLRTYCLFKDRYHTEEYVKLNVLSRAERSTIARMRNGTFPLNVELGRYRRIPLNRRICDLCNNDIETELHFLCYCDQYENERSILFNYIYRKTGINITRLSDDRKLMVILSNEHIQKGVCNFIQTSYNKRHLVT